jgi:hypothetical protein
VRGPAVIAEYQRVVVHEHSTLMLDPRASDGISRARVLLDRDRVLALHGDEERRVRGLPSNPLCDENRD